MSEENPFQHDVSLKLTTKLKWLLLTGPFDLSDKALDRGYIKEGRYLGSCYTFQTMPLETRNRVFLLPMNAEEYDIIKSSFDDAKWLMEYMETVNFPEEEDMLAEIEEVIEEDNLYNDSLEGRSYPHPFESSHVPKEDELIQKYQEDRADYLAGYGAIEGNNQKALERWAILAYENESFD